MELRHYLSVLRRGWLILAAAVIVALLGAAAIIALTPPTYQSELRIYVSVDDPEDADELGLGAIYTQELTRSFVELAESPAVLEPVIEDLGLDESVGALAGRIDVETQVQTVILETTVTDGDPEKAAAIAGSFAESLDSVIQGLTFSESGGGTLVTLTPVEEPSVATQPSAPNSTIILGLGLLVGFSLGIVILALREVLDTRVRTEDDVSALSGLTVLGAVPRDREIAAGTLIPQADPSSPWVESFRTLRTNLGFLDKPVSSLVITSAIRGEGASSVAVNLALSLHEAGERVLLVDADMRAQTATRMLGLESDRGLAEVLTGSSSHAEALQLWGAEELAVLPAGTAPPNPNELLGSSGMQQLMIELNRDYDVVLIDAPPLLPVSDASVLSAVSAGMLLVVGLGRVDKKQVQKALETAQMVDARIHGLVPTRIQTRGTSAHAYRMPLSAQRSKARAAAS